MTDVEILLRAAEMVEADARGLRWRRGSRTRWFDVVDQAEIEAREQEPPEPIWNASARRWVLRGRHAAGKPRLALKSRHLACLLPSAAGEPVKDGPGWGVYRDAVYRLQLTAVGGPGSVWWFCEACDSPEGLIDLLVGAAMAYEPGDFPPYVYPVKSEGK